MKDFIIAALLIPVPVDFAICIIAFAVVQYGVVVWLLWTVLIVTGKQIGRAHV